MDDLRLLINEASRHAVQRRSGAYSYLHGAITDRMIEHHMKGHVTLANPVVGDDGRSSYLALDDDFYKKHPDSPEVREDSLRRIRATRQLVEELVPDDAILSLHTGGCGGHTIVAFEPQPVEDVVPVVQALQAYVCTALGTKPRQFEGFPSTTECTKNGTNCRVLRLPGFYRPKARWSRRVDAEGSFEDLPTVDSIPRLGIRPLGAPDFRNLTSWAREQAPQTRKWFGRRISEAQDACVPTGSDLRQLRPILRFCPVFADSMRRILGTSETDDFDWQDAIFVGSVAGQIPGALEQIVASLGEIRGYAAELLRKLRELQRRGTTTAMSCRSAQRDRVCPGDCPARCLAGVRSPVDFLKIADDRWFGRRLRTAKPLSLEDARAELHESLASSFSSALVYRPRIVLV